MKKLLIALSALALVSCKSYQITCHEGIAGTTNDIIVPIKNWKWKIKSKERKFKRHSVPYQVITWDSEYYYYLIKCDTYKKILTRWEAKRVSKWNRSIESNILD